MRVVTLFLVLAFSFAPLQTNGVDAGALQLVKQCATDEDGPQWFYIKNTSGQTLSTDEAGLRWWEPGEEPPRDWTAIPGPWEDGTWRAYAVYAGQVALEAKILNSDRSLVRDSCGIYSYGVRALNLPIVTR